MSMSVEEFLKLPSANIPLLATVEATDDPTRVLVTPWQPATGCLCHAALEIAGDLIASLETTPETHACCGKLLRVVQVSFTSTGERALSDVFRQLVARRASASNVGARDSSCVVACSEEAADCIANCGSPGCKAACIRQYMRCTRGCGG